MNISLNKEKWLTTGISIVNNIDDNLLIEFKSSNKISQEYIQYEVMSGFSKYNKLDIKDISKNSVYEIDFDGYIEDSLSVQLFINTYSYENKISSNAIDIGSRDNICTSKDVECMKLAIRVSGQGKVCINKINIKCIDRNSYINSFSNNIKSKDNYLILTNIYPSDSDLYRNAFVHRRAKLYKENGLDIHVYSIKQKGAFLSKYNFDGIEVYKGDYESLELLLNNNSYKKILIHFVNEEMISILNKCCPQTPLIIWTHGVEACRWSSRSFNYTQDEIDKNKKSWDEADDKKMEFMRGIYKNPNYSFIFVSNWFLKDVCKNQAKCEIKNAYVIPNVVDENIFRYSKKDESKRIKILSIKPFNSKKYANDLITKAILELSKRSFFEKLEFNIYGKGLLFEECTNPIKNFSNVNVYEIFLNHEQMAQKYIENGIYLCPTRWDSQGVSMCEAMSSGLVVISNDVTAISEYVIDGECGILAREESYIDIANAIEYLYYNPLRYLDISENASIFIQKKCASDIVIKQELEIIKKD